MITVHATYADSFFKKTRGLIGEKDIQPLLLKTRFGIHTFGVKETIDVLILNKDNIVVASSTIKPNRLFFWNPWFDRVLELPRGTIKEKDLLVGSKINLLVK